jgi:hypothetical protein
MIWRRWVTESSSSGHKLAPITSIVGSIKPEQDEIAEEKADPR